MAALDKNQIQKDITLFNSLWDKWMEVLGKRIPTLADSFVQIQNKLFALQQREGVEYPVQYFQQFAGPYLQMIFKKQTEFFEKVYQDTEGNCLPKDFVQYYDTLSEQDQQHVWTTLEKLLELAGRVNRDFATICQDVREKVELAE